MDSYNSRETRFVEVLLPLNLNKSFTYRVPFNLNAEIDIGKRVTVPFGKSKFMAGVISGIGYQPPKEYEAKYIVDIIDEYPIVSDVQLSFWEWISNYYMCSLGQVLNAALPAGLKMEGEAKVILHPDFNWNQISWDQSELKILEHLENQIEASISQLIQAMPFQGVHKYLRSLYMKEAILIKEDISSSYSTKKEKLLSISPEYSTDEELNRLFQQLERKAPKQVEVLMRMLSLADVTSKHNLKDLNKAGLSKAAINGLVEKGILILESVDVSRIQLSANMEFKLSLSAEQNRANEQISEAFHQHKPALLHGITSSGKTLIYMSRINQALKDGKQVLYLLPEIALTSQLLDRLASYFGDKMVVSHSKFSNNERVEAYYRIQSGEPLLILGTRSAIFLPFQDLDLIVVDEEHESSFKQHEPAPRFQARDAALYLAHMLNSNVILGSATPSFESYYNATQNKYELVELNKRYDDAILPEIVLVDMQEQKKQKRNSGIFSDVLIAALREAREQGKQSILFQNKKGYVPVLECTQCSWTPQCINCDISLTYYKFQNNLRCHYCGYTREPVHKCAACGHNGLELIGYGTERIEDELNLYLPELKTQRLDYNTTRRKTSHKKIIKAFAQGEIDVLIGTQMVAKGLDFDKVSLVGIVNADHLLNFPDFRAYERAYQLMMQVAGRAGRRRERGKVYIQSAKIDHPVLHHMIDDSFKDFYSHELSEREVFHYPPFNRLIKITLKHRDALQLHKCGQTAQLTFNRAFGKLMLGPEKPYIGKIRNMYLLNFLLKLDHSASLSGQKKVLRKLLDQLEQDEQFKGIRIVIDVDPI